MRSLVDTAVPLWILPVAGKQKHRRKKTTATRPPQPWCKGICAVEQVLRERYSITMQEVQ